MKISDVKVFLTLVALLVFYPSVGPLTWAAPIQELPEELEQVKIEDRFIKSDEKQVGTIVTLTGKGKVVVLRRETKEAYFGSEKDPIYNGDALYTLKDCRCRIEFENKDVVIMAPNTHLDVDEVSASFLKGKKSSLFAMTRGKAIFYALRLFRYAETEFQLKTPTATVGVRGTKFGTEIEGVREKQSRLLDRMLASRAPVVAQVRGGGENIIARFYVLEGTIDVTSPIDGRTSMLRENEILETDRRGLGDVRFDPEKTRAFVEDVVSGMVTKEELPPLVRDKGFLQNQVERTEQLNEIRQRAITPPVSPPMEHGGGHQSP
jgi:hypothetical protein